MIVLNSVNINPVEQKNRYAPDEMALFLDMTVISKEGKLYRANPGIAIKGQSELRQLADTVMSQSLILVFNKVIDQKTGKLEIGLKETGNITDLLTLKVYEFPMINLLWLGVVITVLGFIMSIIQRVKVSGEKLTKTV
jgi:cytochrome c-type biogenesis protein CcmF